jgi:hypothetical protein
MAAMLLFYIPSKEIVEAAYFSKVNYRTSLNDPVLSGASVAPASVVSNSITLIPNFVKIGQFVQKFKG